MRVEAVRIDAGLTPSPHGAHATSKEGLGNVFTFLDNGRLQQSHRGSGTPFQSQLQFIPDMLNR